MSQALIQAIDAAEVTTSDTQDLTTISVLYVGVGGHVKVKTRQGSDVTFYNMNNGQFVPVQVKRIYATGTTATNLVSMPINAYSR